MKPTIDICVATYKRPDVLKQLLDSLVVQETEGEFTFAINVADNDASGSAKAMVQTFMAAGHLIRYAIEPQQSVSLARNKSLSLATGDYIATTDDDLYVDRRWLLSLYRTLKAHHADVVHGPVKPEFLRQTPIYVRHCRIFDRPSPPTGSTEGYVFTTANSLFRRALISDLALPFDPEFGKTGGEDSAFFTQLQQRGCHMIWCREAVVIGPVPPQRANLKWIVKRSFRYGNTYLRYQHQAQGNHPRFNFFQRSLKAIKSMGAGLLSLGISLVRPRYPGQGVEYLMDVVLAVTFYLGILAYYGNVQYEEYRPQ